jgi:beta-galactosidase
MFMRSLRVLSLVTTLTPLASGLNQAVDLAGDWEFRQSTEAAWSQAHVPHSHREITEGSGSSGLPVHLRRRFRLDLGGRKALLHIDNAPQPAVVVNGKEAAEAPPLEFGLVADITPFLRDGDNEIEIRTTVPGVQGGVRIHLTGPMHFETEGLMVDTPGWKGGAAIVRIRTRVLSDAPRAFRVVARLMDPGGKQIAVTEQVSRMSPANVELRTPAVPDPPLWSPETPRLCKLIAELYEGTKLVETAAASFGFRWFHFDPESGFHLNGRPLKLRGVVYTTLGPKKFPDRRALWNYELALLKNMGLNFVRPTPGLEDTFLEECDRAGLLATVRVHDFGDASQEGDAATVRRNMWRDIRQKFNHPSVIAWNFVSEGASARRVALQNVAARALREVDPERSVLCNELGWRSPGTVGLVEADVAGQGNYTGWYEGTLDHIGPYLDRYRMYLRERYGRFLPVIVSNYGAAADNTVHTDHPRRNDYSVEYHTAFHRRFEQEISSRKWMAGGLIFCYRDIDGGQAIPRHTWKGVLDLEDKPKDAYFYYQSKWTTRPMVHIAKKAWTPREVWPAGSARAIEVFSNQDSVELFLNGRPLGVRTREQGFTWTATMREGRNELKAVTARASDSTVVDIRFQTPSTKPAPAQVVWRYLNDGWLMGTPATADLDADGRLEVVFGSYDGNLYVLDYTGKLRWKYSTGTEVFSTPVVRVMSPGQRPSIVFTSSDALFVLSHDGKLVWKRPGVRTFDRSAKSPAVSEDTVYATSDRGELLAFDFQGRQRWTFKIPALCLTAPLVHKQSVLFAADDGFTYLISSNGTLMWKKDSRLGGEAVGLPPNQMLPAINDHAIFSGAGRLQAWDHAGNLLWERKDLRGPVRLVGDRLALVSREVLHILDTSGRDVWRFSLGDRRDYFSVPPIAADVNGDEAPDYLAGTRGTHMVAISHSGQALWRFPTEDEISGAAAVADLDADGRTEVVFGSRDGFLYVLRSMP